MRSFASGDALIGPSITRRLIQEFALATKPRNQDPPERESLTPCERDAFPFVAQGLSNAEIASRLTVEESTAKSHVGRILMKLHLRDRVQAVVLAYESGFVTRESRTWRYASQTGSQLGSRRRCRDTASHRLGSLATSKARRRTIRNW